MRHPHPRCRPGSPAHGPLRLIALSSPQMEHDDERTRDAGTIAEAAALAGAIERWAGDLALAEEPARFLVALEEGAAPS